MENYKETRLEKLFNALLTLLGYVFGYLLYGFLFITEYAIKILFLPLVYSYFNRFLSYKDIIKDDTLVDSSNDNDDKQKILWIISISLMLLVILVLIIFPPVQQNQGPWLYTLCNDGWISYSRGSGTCSWHGGINRYVYEPLPNTYLIWPYVVWSITSFTISFIQSILKWKSFVKANKNHKNYFYYQLIFVKKYFKSALLSKTTNSS